MHAYCSSAASMTKGWAVISQTKAKTKAIVTFITESCKSTVVMGQSEHHTSFASRSAFRSPFMRFIHI